MLRRFKHLCWAAGIVIAAQSAVAFSFYGPQEPYQVAALGYNNPWDFVKNLGEEYRWNVPVLYYTFDQSYVDYFGTNGMAAADAAFNMLNLSLTNVGSWSQELDEIPLESKQLNYTAQALQLFDLKSFVLQDMVTELCLADPVAFVWTLRIRVPIPGVTCGFDYFTIMRNFDPVTYDPTPYVNGVLYSYYIFEGCPIPLTYGETVPVTQDPEAKSRTPVARAHDLFAMDDYWGYYYTGLTRDDVGGLRYLLQTNTIILEPGGPGTLVSVTNTTNALIYTSNLTQFAQLALTNSDGQLAALYPGLVFSAPATNYPVVVTNITTTAYFTNSPYSPATNAVPILAYATNIQLSIQLDYHHFYGNLEVVQFKNGAWTNFPVSDLSTLTGPQLETIQTVSINPSNTPYAPSSQLSTSTNITEKDFITNTVVGEFFILTTNYCNMLILADELALTNLETNLVFGATNFIALTNTSTSTNTAGSGNVSSNIEVYAQNLLVPSTNHVFLALPVSCTGTNISLREGIQRMQFIRRDYDSLLNRYWNPITNTFQAVAITNNATYVETISRVVTAPDIVLSAADLAPEPATGPGNINVVDLITTLNFNTNGVLNSPFGLVSGPGTVALAGQGFTTIFLTYNKVGPVLENLGFPPLGISATGGSQGTALTNFIWASFDGTTNFPVIYPVGTDITNFVNYLVLQTYPSSPLPSGMVGVPYAFSYVNPATGVSWTNTFSGTGGVAPYTFTLATGSSLPPGLLLAANGVVSGTPSTAGTYSFTLQMNDSGQRFIDRAYSVTIAPSP